MAGELRITGGTLVRRRFLVPGEADAGLVRPTADRVREALFSSLGGEVLTGARVLDAFAGSGALGLEALSRGAVHCQFFERSPRVAQVLRRNLGALSLERNATVTLGDAGRLLRGLPDDAFDLQFVDPPYATPLEGAWLAELVRTLAPGGLVVFERDARSRDDIPEALALRRERVYGQTRVSIWGKRSTAQES